MTLTTQLTPDYSRADAEKYQLRAGLAAASAAVFAVNSNNGWFEEDRTFGDDIALLHSEVSETLEAYREGGLDDQTRRHARTSDGTLVELDNPKPEGVGSEAADQLIRLLDFCKRRNIDLAFEFERKLYFNSTRGHKHGGKLL